jgi:hypothetical protein
MAKTTVPQYLSATTSIIDSGDATAITIDGSENVAIGGGTNHDGAALLVSHGDSGVTTFSDNADELVIENSTNAGISILTPNNASGSIIFGDSDDDDIGKIVYNHNDNSLTFTATTVATSGNATVGGTLGVTGAVTANAGVVVDNITIDGTEIDLSSGDLTLDVADDIILDADGGDIIFKDDGTTIAHLKNDSSDLQIISIVQDKDIILRGNDGGSYLNALTLDMSDAGKAIFGGDIQIADSKYIRVGDSSDLLIYHDASHSYIEDDGTGDLRLKGGTVRLQGTGGTNLLVGSTGGATTLYHDNSAKLATSSTGVTLSGNLTMMSNVVYASQVYVHDRLGHLNDASTFINFDTDRIEFATDGEAMRITSDKKVYIGTASPSIAGILSVEGGNAGVPALYVSNTNADSLGIRSQVNNNTSNNAIYEAINTDGTQWKIRNDGDHQGTDTSIGSISDSRLKKDVSDLTYDIAKFKQYRPVEFNWINDELHRSPDSGKTRGFLAQEVGALDNYYVDKYEAEGDDIPLVDEDGMAHGTKFGYKDAMYISVIKQLITRLETAEAKIAELESS